MTFEEARRWWFSRVDYERRAPQPGDLKLDRMRELLHRLGDPQSKFKSVHVAGSKGKGSTCAMLESVLRHAHYRTGLFTSPHLSDVRERIQFNNRLITPEELVAVAEVVRPVVETLEAEGQPPTFFEVTTALGFLHFAWQDVEIAVVEVGLGGRFDATNVLKPLVSVITSISLDHTAILGETLEQIAFEKAGIIKPDVPVVSGVTELGPRAVIEHIAAERGAPLIQLGVDFFYSRERDSASRAMSSRSLTSEHVTVQTRAQSVDFNPHLHGEHQAANAAVAVATLDALAVREFQVAEIDIHVGLASVHWPARFELLRTKPKVILDCAHNVASAMALTRTVNEWFPHSGRSLMFAASSDKDVAGMFAVLASHFEKVYLTRADSPRAIPPEELAKSLPPATKFACFSKPLDAWEAARTETPAEGLIVIAGSVFLAGELRPPLLKRVSPPVE
jgi:dihydrofolate synthase / folylpolyglutamate synthase